MEYLFSYGTLLLENVQKENFGRKLTGAEDVLVGYRLEDLLIRDDKVLGISGREVHLIAVRTGDPGDRIAGVLFELDEQELIAADAYEVDDYVRVPAVFASGKKGWVYVKRSL